MFMNIMSPKERLNNSLIGKRVDRPPVICSGGMMNAAIVDVMQKTGHTLPEAHTDSSLMSELSTDIAGYTGFENFGLPFCMTVEAEALGSGINMGTLACEPKIASEPFSSVTTVEFRDIHEAVKSSRINTVAGSAYTLSRKYPDIPVVGSLTGPISTAASIVDPMTFLKDLRKSREESHRVIEYVSDFLIEYAKILVESGAGIICIGDPTATGEILGPKIFGEFALHHINRVIDGIHSAGALAILHICGNMNSVKHLIPELKADALSTDAMVNLRELKREFPGIKTMGNLSTYALEFGDPYKIEVMTDKLLKDGIDIISPACGLSTSTGLDNIRAMTETVKSGGA